MKLRSIIVGALMVASGITIASAAPFAATKSAKAVVVGDSISGYVYNQSSYNVTTTTQGFPTPVQPLKTTDNAPSYQLNVADNVPGAQVTYKNNLGYGCIFNFEPGLDGQWSITGHGLTGAEVCNVDSQNGLVINMSGSKR